MIGCVGLFFDRMFEKLKDARYFNAERFTCNGLNLTAHLTLWISAHILLMTQY
jgi:hypothetical protein